MPFQDKPKLCGLGRAKYTKKQAKSKISVDCVTSQNPNILLFDRA